MRRGLHPVGAGGGALRRCRPICNWFYEPTMDSRAVRRVRGLDIGYDTSGVLDMCGRRVGVIGLICSLEWL
jgi:hypothetical protein